MQTIRGGSLIAAVIVALLTVRVVAGDPSFIDSTYVFAAEGTTVINGAPSSTTHWFDNTVTVSVTDGKLTLTNAAGSVNNKIDFIVVNTQ